jgi:hypothetical protein
MDKLIARDNARPDFWCLTTYFNPAHYKSRVKNHNIYVENIKRQKINLCIIEQAFGDDPFELDHADIRLRSNSILWPKERMLNYALTLLPKECKYIAWIDGDVIFENDSWPDLAVEKFEEGNDILQLFESVHHLPPKHDKFNGEILSTERSLVWQAKSHSDFINKRKKFHLLYATTGFAWAGRRSIFEDAGGFYDKHVLGANDNIIIDCCLDTFELHHYYRAGQGTPLLEDMMDWAHNKFKTNVHKADYLPLNIYHLFHGAKKNRGYLTREDIVKKHNYDPKIDIKLNGNVYEWASDKPEFHKNVEIYFASRKEDSDDL